ncbi:MAG: pseudouridine synthase [Lachnospiraceae bacterium]|nr:pseudouridine synthase [Lachnospiraceae bacterium]
MDQDSIRLNKYISAAGVCSRREADRLIENGQVMIQRSGEDNAAAARMGERVCPGDRVFVNGKEVAAKELKKLYYMLNKPRGIICTGDRRISGNIIDYAGLTQYISYAGRLDRDSTGLVLLTNDGELNDMIMRASNYHEKEYIVKVDKVLTPEFIIAMQNGMEIVLDDDRHLTNEIGRKGKRKGTVVRTRPCRVRRLGKKEFSIILTQGFNRQIRRMCLKKGYSVLEIKRIRIMNLLLGDLKEGAMRPLTDEEIAELRKMAVKPGTDRQPVTYRGR